MRSQVIKVYAMTLDDARKQVADVPCERFAELPFEGAKHPGWVLGHLALASGMGLAHLRGEEGVAGVPEAWSASCMGVPSGERALFGTKDQLLGELERVHKELAQAYQAASDERLATEFPIPDWRSFFPTIGDAEFYLMAHHEGYHLGQLSQWRRAAGFTPIG